MIRYTSKLFQINENMLQGFFVDWPNPPTPSTHLRILRGSYCVWLAIDSTTNQVIGFINAVSDGVLSAYIPLVEILPEYQNKGIGKQLISHMLDSLKNLYMVDLLCDEKLQAYYTKLGMTPATGSFLRNHNRQNGK